MVGINDAPRSQKLIRPTGALESLDAERRRFNDRLLLLLLRLRRPLFERARRRRSGEPASPTAESVQIPLSVHNSPILFCLSPPACATAFSLQFADPVSPLPASMRHGVRARVPSRTSHPVFRALATERRGPLVEPERSIPLRRALLIVRPEPRPRRCCSGEPGLPPPRPHSVLCLPPPYEHPPLSSR
jgi:hypothetical protein